MRRVGLVMVVAVACAVGSPAVAPPAAGSALFSAEPGRLGGAAEAADQFGDALS